MRPPHPDPQRTGQVREGIVAAHVQGLDVGIEELLLAGVLLADQLLDLGLAGRFLEILANRRLDAFAAQKLQRLPGLAATRVVPDRHAHRLLVPLPLEGEAR